MRVPLSRRGRVAGAGALALIVALTLAACGSQLDPDEVVGLENQAGSTAAPDAAGTDGRDTGSDPGVDPGTNPGTDPGTGPGNAPEQAQGEENDADGGVEAASCEGFDNDQTGVTADTINLVNVADISGPVPGIFESAQQGARAFLEYFNSTEDI